MAVMTLLATAASRTSRDKANQTRFRKQTIFAPSYHVKSSASHGSWDQVRSKLKLTPHQIREALARREAGETLSDIGRSYNVSHSTNL